MIDTNKNFAPNMLLSKLFSVAVAFALALLTGCISSSYPPVPEGQRNVDVDFDYVLGPGDSVSIFVWGNPELSGGGVVRPDGKLTTQLVEDLQASGKTTTQLARDIEEAYSEYVRQPVVSVSIGGFVGVPEQAIRVMGEATTPKRVTYSKHMTLLDLMIQVGGLTPYAAGNRAVLIRTVDGKPVSYGLRLDDLVRDGDYTANLNVMPGDIIIIPESWF